MTDQEKGVRKMTFRLPKEVAKQIRVKALENEDSIQNICETAILEYLKK